MSRNTRLSPLWLSASSSACLGLLIITVITPAYKAQRDKNARELKLANAAITDMQMRQRDVAALDPCIHEELADAKAENGIVMMLPLVVVGYCIKAVCRSVREAIPPPAWIMQPPDWQTPLNGIISPSEGQSYAKTAGRNPEVY